MRSLRFSVVTDLRASLGFRKTIGSVLAAFFGVQSSENRKRDFEQGSPARFIVVALLMTLGLVGLLAMLVKLLIGSLGA